jgi:alcohol dehydrogenase class IV
MTANVNLPRILRVGAGASKELVATLSELSLSRPLLVTDEFMVKQGYCAALQKQLDDAALKHGIFQDSVPDPTTDSVEDALKILRAGDYDCVVGLGGGSSMDTAKAVAFMAGREGEIRQYKVPCQINSGLPIIEIPTTAGTGSEVTKVAVITDTQSHEKMLCMGLGLMPIAALVDFELTLTMPYRLTADTGIDSLCHALEAYVSGKSNPYTDGMALLAMRAINEHIRTACAEPDNRQAREAMMLAATQAGMAFANASVTLIHGMSRPIGALFHVPHGLSNAMLLPAVTAWSISHATERYADCARYMGMADAGDSDEAAADKLVFELRRLTADLSVPSPEQYGIEESVWLESVELMSDQALASGSPANNPRVPTAAEIVAIYGTVYR